MKMDKRCDCGPKGEARFTKCPEDEHCKESRINMNKSVFDPKKPVVTRGGVPARIICTDAKLQKGYPILALIQNTEEDTECYGVFTPSGQSPSHRLMHDLVNIKVKKWKWIFRGYQTIEMTAHLTEEEAIHLSLNPIGRIQESLIEE